MPTATAGDSQAARQSAPIEEIYRGVLEFAAADCESGVNSVIINPQSVDFGCGPMLIDARNFSCRRESELNQSTGELPLQQDFIVANKLGIHARVAAQIVKVACQFESEIVISKCGVEVNAKSILDLMTLVCPHGSKIHITARGPDASEAINALASLFQTKFGEP